MQKLEKELIEKQIKYYDLAIKKLEAESIYNSASKKGFFEKSIGEFWENFCSSFFKVIILILGTLIVLGIFYMLAPANWRDKPEFAIGIAAGIVSSVIVVFIEKITTILLLKKNN